MAITDKLQIVNYCPKSKQHLPPSERPKYKTHEVYKTIEGKVDNRTVRLKYRLIFVWSEAKAAEEAKTRERHLNKIREEFAAVEKNLNKFSLKTEAKIVQCLEKAKGKNAIGDVFTYQLTQRSGKFKLRWEIDQETLDRQIMLEGA